MVAVISTLVFVVAAFAAIGVIAAMIGAERDRIIGLLDGSLREVALPRAIAVRPRAAPHRAMRPAPVRAALRAAA
ncbi:hypothetical protein [Sphingomonas gilva]|uniref:hypothetical protein n=1 Tax=Sphingomonas gilva TaxID=2305907 RepID=UPI001CA3D581|nr:hypothetical protein [Sphingomonas gilva]